MTGLFAITGIIAFVLAVFGLGFCTGALAATLFFGDAYDGDDR